MTGSCLCGAVIVTIDAKPTYINDCNCNLCRKAGGAWGYFASASVTTTGRTTSFSRSDKKTPAVEIHSCDACATTTHWVLSKAFKEQNSSADQMGVNMRLFDPDELQGVEVRFPNGKAWSGAGPFNYRRPPMTISERLPW